MTGAEVYRIVSKKRGQIVTIHLNQEKITGTFSSDAAELVFSSVSNVWDYVQNKRHVQLRSHWINKIEE